MRIRKLSKLLFVGAIAAGLLLAGRHYLENSALRKVKTVGDSLKREIAERIPVGSDAEHVLNFLDSKRIQHTVYESAGGDESVRSVLGAPAIIEGRVSIPTISLYHYSIHMVFKFDDEGKFSSYADKVEGTFL